MQRNILKIKKMIILTKDLKKSSYKPVLDTQLDLFNTLVDNRKNNIKNEVGYLLLVEHYPVITLGRHAKIENILKDKQYLEEQGIETYNIERGGDVTYHAPGQLVIYPVIDFGELHLGLKQYVSLLEESIMETLRSYGIQSQRVTGATGVWIGEGVKERKICAIGLKCSRFCSMHGVALNVNNKSLQGFSNINPCGFIDKGVTSIEKETGSYIDMQDVKERFLSVFFSLIFSL